ncbi:Hypothetical predicted protein, partial [Mytilus galloprovincialis]
LKPQENTYRATREYIQSHKRIHTDVGDVVGRTQFTFTRTCYRDMLQYTYLAHSLLAHSLLRPNNA